MASTHTHTDQPTLQEEQKKNGGKTDMKIIKNNKK